MSDEVKAGVEPVSTFALTMMVKRPSFFSSRDWLLPIASELLKSRQQLSAIRALIANRETVSAEEIKKAMGGNVNELQKLIVAQSAIIGELLGYLTGVSWHDDVSAELREKIQQAVAELREKHDKAMMIVPELANR